MPEPSTPEEGGTVSDRCSCWSHEGRRIGWTEDDPCPLHPDDHVRDPYDHVAELEDPYA